MKKFEVRFLELAREFLKNAPKSASKKIIYNIDKAKAGNDPELFKKLAGDIWEFRTTYNGIHYRLFAFWDSRDNQNPLVVCSHGIVKKHPKYRPKKSNSLKLLESSTLRIHDKPVKTA
jgi:phage-related protein